MSAACVGHSSTAPVVSRTRIGPGGAIAYVFCATVSQCHFSGVAAELFAEIASAAKTPISTEILTLRIVSGFLSFGIPRLARCCQTLR